MTDSIKIKRHGLMLQLSSFRGEIEACEFVQKMNQEAMEKAIKGHNKIVAEIDKLDFPCAE
jgi:hypothetical protein